MSLGSDQTRARLGLGTAQFAEPRGRGGEAEIRAVLDTAAPDLSTRSPWRGGSASGG